MASAGVCESIDGADACMRSVPDLQSWNWRAGLAWHPQGTGIVDAESLMHACTSTHPLSPGLRSPPRFIPPHLCVGLLLIQSSGGGKMPPFRYTQPLRTASYVPILSSKRPCKRAKIGRSSHDLLIGYEVMIYRYRYR